MTFIKSYGSFQPSSRPFGSDKVIWKAGATDVSLCIVSVLVVLSGHELHILLASQRSSSGQGCSLSRQSAACICVCVWGGGVWVCVYLGARTLSGGMWMIICLNWNAAFYFWWVWLRLPEVSASDEERRSPRKIWWDVKADYKFTFNRDSEETFLDFPICFIPGRKDISEKKETTTTTTKKKISWCKCWTRIIAGLIWTVCYSEVLPLWKKNFFLQKV